MSVSVGSDLFIVPAGAGDAAEIAAIYAHHVLHGTATFEIDAPDAADMAQRIARITAAGAPWLVARDAAGDLLGYAYAAQYHAREAYRYCCEDSIYLAPDRLGRGIGTRLLTTLIAAAEVSGFRQMIAKIAGGEAASVALHARAGFAETGLLRAAGRKHGKWLDVVLMQRSLGQGDATPPEGEGG